MLALVVETGKTRKSQHALVTVSHMTISHGDTIV